MFSGNTVRRGFAVVLLLVAGSAFASGPVELISKADPLLPPQAVGVSEAPSVSADGRYVAFASTSPNLVPGQNDGNQSWDVFLLDSQTGTVTLVSRSSSSPTRTGNAASINPKISADGNWVAFLSEAIDLIPGQIDSLGLGATADVFLWQRATGAITLVSCAASSPLASGNGSSLLGMDISADGAWVAFLSNATNLVSGQSDANAFPDVYLFNRAAGTVSLVSHASGSPATTGSGSSWEPRISSNGNYVVFSSQSNDLIAGQSDANSEYDVFLYERSTGTSVLVSHASGSAVTAANGTSYGPVIGSDGQWVAYASSSTNLVAGQVSTGLSNVFLYDRIAGTSILVSRTNGSATTAANQFSTRPSISADGAYVAFESLATDLVAGQVDGNSADDIFLFDRAGGTVTLVSGASASATTTANGGSSFPVISSDGGRVVFNSQATDLVSGQSDGNADRDVFLYTRSSASLALVSHCATPTMTGDGFSEVTVLDQNGGHVAFASVATDLAVQSDTNGGSDVFLYTTADESIEPVSFSPPVASSTPAALSATSVGALSADGRYVTFFSFGTGLAAGMTDANGDDGDVYLRDRVTGTTTLVSHSVSSPTTTGNHHSQLISISGDGAYAVFASYASNLVAGSDGGPSFGDSDIFLFERATGTNVLVSHAPGLPTQAANGTSEMPKISADGGYVVFSNYSGDLVSGLTDANSGRDVFLFSRATGQNILVSRSSSSSSTTGNGQSEMPSLSANGGFVAFLSEAFDLVTGQVQNNADYNVFLFDRDAETTTLVSHASSSLTATGNGGASSTLPLYGPAVSADGAYVAFASRATDLVSGQIDTNIGADVFLWERATGAITLVSRASGSVVTAGNAASDSPSISADGRYIAFESDATDLISGQVDTNSAYDVFLYDRVTGTTTLVSHAPGSATLAGAGSSVLPFISADGSAIAFFSYNPSLMGGQVDGNGSADVFIHDRLSGTNRLLSHTPSSSMAAANAGSGFAQISADGSTVSFNSWASDLVAGDYNLHTDVFVHDRPGLDFHTLTPCRLLDTRTPQDGPALASGITETVILTGACGIPANASAVALNVTVTQSSGGGHLTLFPGDFLLLPNTSTINFQAGQTRANNAVLSLAGDGSLGIQPAVTGSGTVHVILDVTGYFVAGAN